MSTKRICICGKNRGKDPITITVTRVGNKNVIETSGFSPLCTSSETDLNSTEPVNAAESEGTNETHDEKIDIASVQKSPTPSESTLEKIPVTENQKDIDSSNNNEELIVEEDNLSNETAVETPKEKLFELDHENENTNAEKATDGDDSLFYSINEENNLDEEPNANESHEDENNNSKDTENKDNENQTIMAMTDISVNTIPFLDNLFIKKEKLMPSRCQRNSPVERCSVEIFVFGKHAKDCKQCSVKQKLTNFLFGNNTIVETIGKISYPAKCKTMENDISSVQSHLNYNSNDGNSDFFEEAFRKLEAYIKKEQLFKKIKSKTVETSDSTLKKFILDSNLTKSIQTDELHTSPKETLDIGNSTSDINCTADFSVQFEGHSKLNKNRSVQFNHICMRTKDSKWYDAFLMCFGIRGSEIFYDNNLRNTLSTVSSNQITRYLKI